MQETKFILASIFRACNMQARVIAKREIIERDGIARRATILERAIPVEPMPEQEVRRLSIAGPDGRSLPGSAEAEARNQDGKVNWLRLTARVAMPANGRLPVSIQTHAALKSGKFETPRGASKVTVEADNCRLTVTGAGEMDLTSGGRGLLSGAWGAGLRGDARAVLWGSGFRQFVYHSVEMEEQTTSRATLLLKAFMATNQQEGPAALNPGRRIDVELRLLVSAFTPNIRFAWRIANQLGYKTWLQKYALRGCAK